MPGSPSAKRAWIEIDKIPFFDNAVRASPSAKRAWIEIMLYLSGMPRDTVALCEEGVDRNSVTRSSTVGLSVALCEEGVDRNIMPSEQYKQYEKVALCEEGVDRNTRRQFQVVGRQDVALCEEGVDRNANKAVCAPAARESRPLRRGRG